MLLILFNQINKTMKKLIIITIPAVICAACLLSGCAGKMGATSGTDSTAMMAQKNKKTAMAAQMAFVNHQTDSLFKDCAADFVDYGDGSMKPMKGVDSAKVGLKMFMAGFPDASETDMVAFAQGDSVIITGTYTGTFKGAMGPVKPTGKSFKVADADIFTFDKQGKVTSHRSIQSANTYLAAVGASMPPGK
jgi:hypothetical protein